MLAWSCGRAKCQCCTATVTVVVYNRSRVLLSMHQGSAKCQWCLKALSSSYYFLSTLEKLEENHPVYLKFSTRMFTLISQKKNCAVLSKRTADRENAFYAGRLNRGFPVKRRTLFSLKKELIVKGYIRENVSSAIRVVIEQKNSLFSKSVTFWPRALLKGPK